MVDRVKKKGYHGVAKMQAVNGAGHESPQGPSMDVSLSVSPLDVSYPSQNVIQGEDPWIDMFGVIPPGPDALRIARDDAVDDFRVTPRRGENDHISSPDIPALVRNDMQPVPVYQKWVHAGADVIDIPL